MLKELTPQFQLIMRLLVLVAYFATLIIGDCRGLASIRLPRQPDKIIPGRYIVRLKSPQSVSNESSYGLVQAIAAMHVDWLNTLLDTSSHSDSKVHHVYDLRDMAGYAGDFSAELLDQIRGRPEVDYVEPDQIVHVLDEDLLSFAPESILNWRDLLRGPLKRQPKAITKFKVPAIKRKPKKGHHRERVTKIQKGAPWGLKRLSNKMLAVNGQGEYRYPSSAGKGVDVYVIDTGINIRHKDFEGRAVWGKTIPLFDEDIDGNGHGTHCAGIIAGKSFGVAKRAKVHAVKVLMTSGFGTNSDVIKGVEWVIKQHYHQSRLGRRSVANMSLGGGKSKMLEEIVDMAVRAGVHFSVAAGNDNEDACEYSPAGASGPLTVGAIDINDSMAFFSNHGSCVDVFAPGVNITSAWIGSRFASNTISGTSMASPHVAGVLALHLGEQEYEPGELKKVVLSHARSDILDLIPEGTVNRLVCIDHLI